MANEENLEGALKMCEVAIRVVEQTEITLREDKEIVQCLGWLMNVRENIEGAIKAEKADSK